MQIAPLDGPKTLPVNNQTNSQSSSRDKAIAALIGNSGAPTQEAVPNPTRVSPEEMGAVRPPSGQRDIVESQESSEQQAPEEPLSSQYAALARKEKAIRARAQQQAAELKSQTDALRAQEAAMRSRESEMRSQIQAELESKYINKDRVQQDPLNALAELGLSYDQITELMLNQQSPSDPRTLNEIKTLKAELAAIRADQESTKKSYESDRQGAYQESLNQITLETKSLIRNNPEFETIRETGSTGDVVDLIRRTWEQDKILLTVEEAAQEVENELAERLYKYSSKINKVKNRFTTPAAAAPVSQKQSIDGQKPLKTLTNTVSTTRQLSARERAILAMKGELK